MVKHGPRNRLFDVAFRGTYDKPEASGLTQVTLSIVFITGNEEAIIGRTLQSVQPLMEDPGGEVIVVDSESQDRTVEIAERMGARVFIEPWKGFAAQKNSALDKAQCDWVLLLDADESLPAPLCKEIREALMTAPSEVNGFAIPRMNYYFGRWIKHGGYWPDRKPRLFRLGKGRIQPRPVHENVVIEGRVEVLRNGLHHDGYPTIESYMRNVDWYSSLKADILLEKGYRGFSAAYIVFGPAVKFLYNYVLRGGFLDGKEGLLVHLYHAVYFSLSFAKVWQKSRLRNAAGKPRSSR
jgi:glycosyltransferase involved in cell wall biosynthesis